MENRKTILLIEEGSESSSCKNDLEKHNYEVITAHSGEQAVEMTGKTPGIDLILMGIFLENGMDGTQAAEAILKNHDLPIVFLSSCPDPETAKKLENITSYGFVEKNTNSAVLDVTITMALRHFKANEKKDRELAGHKRTGKQLRKSEEKLRTLVTNALDGIYIMEEEQYTYVNTSFCTITGFSEEEILSPKFHFNRLLTGEAKSIIKKRYEKRKQGIDLPGTYETKIVAKDGTIKDVELGTVQLEKTPLTVIGIMREITQRKQVEKALEQTKQMYFDIFNNLTEAVYIQNTEGTFLDVNKGAETMYGFNREELIGKNPSMIAAKGMNDLERVDRLCGETFATGKTSRFEFWGKRKNGEVFPKEVVVNKGRYYGQDVLIATARDITDRKQADEKLRKSEERYKSIISLSNTGGWEYHRATDYLWCSPEYFFMLGQDPADFPTDGRANLDDVWVNLIHPGDREQATSIFREYLEAGSPGIYENWFRMKHKEGHWVWIWSRGQTLRDPEGNPTGLTVGTHIDISENKKTEELIRGQIEEKNILLSEIHHRVKNNMAVISSLLELQVDFVDHKEDPDKLLRDTQNRIKSMAMVHDLVYKSKDFAEINAEKLIRRLSDYLVDIYRAEGMDISIQIYSDDIMLDMNDSVPFTLLANEVISNAYKHAFTNCKTGSIDVLLDRENGGCRFVVQDNGKGVPDIGKLYNPDSFGYTIIRGLAQQLQGQLEISSPAQGLRVEVWFPDKKEGHERASNSPATK